MNYSIKLQRWFARFLQLQLFLSLISLPILIAWGIPLSLLSPLGNLIFSPILTLFLLFSSLIFFCTLLGVPATVFIYGLEKVTSLWLSILPLGNQAIIIGFAQPSQLFLLSIPLITITILHHKKTNSIYRSIICFILLFTAICVYLKHREPELYIEYIPCNNTTVTLIRDAKYVMLIDTGGIGQRISATSWVQYHLIPHIIKTTGKTILDSVIFLQVNKTSCEALKKLCEHIHIKNIYIPTTDENLYHHNTTIRELLTKLKNKNISCTIINNTCHIILPHGTITLTPQKQIIQENSGIQYPAITVTGTIASQNINLRSCKYKQSKNHKTLQPKYHHNA